MTFKKIAIFLIILSLFVLPASYAALGTDFQAPDEFEKDSNWDTAVSDVYSLKTDDQVELYISEYTDSDYDLFFKTDMDNNYYVSNLEDNMIMGKDNDFNDGYVLEIVEYNGEKYIVYTYLMDSPSNDQIKDSSRYLTEFNELNNVEPISI